METLDPHGFRDEGRAAFERGYDIARCPYADDSPAYSKWREGWRDAFAKFCKKEDAADRKSALDSW